MGKSVWFVKSKCETLDMPSIPNISLLNNKTLLYDLSLGSKQEFTRLITESYEIMAPGLLKALLGDPRYAFFPHLLSLKNYLLCHRGDFCQALMDALASELSKPASHIHRHNLIGNLDVVLKQTVADPEAEKRLDVRLLNAVGNLSGWEIFSLDYHAETPLNTLLSSTAMATYTRAFRFIWRLKRCEHLLASAWKFLSLSSRSTNPISENNQSLFLLSHLTLTDMIQFVDKVMYYLTMVVIEGSWKELEVSLSQAKDLDIYLKSHQAFLDRILLNGTFSRGTTGDESSSRTLQQKLFQLLQLILSFAKHQVIPFH